MRTVAALLILFLAATSTAAQNDSAVDDHIAQFRSQYLNVEKWVGILERQHRDVIRHRDQIIAALELKPGFHVADVGAGTGPYMEGISKLVGVNGRYYGVDIAPKFIGFMRDRAAEAGLDNVTLIVSQLDSATLPQGTMDVVFLINTYHLLEPVKPMLVSLYDALKPGGKLVIVDFDRIAGSSRKWILDRIRADKNTFRKEIENEGFQFEEQVTVTGMDENFFFRFAKPEGD